MVHVGVNLHKRMSQIAVLVFVTNHLDFGATTIAAIAAISNASDRYYHTTVVAHRATRVPP